MHKFSFTRDDKLIKRSDFVRLSKTGAKIHSQHFIAAFHSGQSEKTRLGITVTRSVGCAVTRNRIKRLTREYFRLNKHRFIDSCDINIIAKKKASAASANQIFSSLEGLFDKIVRQFDH